MKTPGPSAPPLLPPSPPPVVLRSSPPPRLLARLPQMPSSGSPRSVMSVTGALVLAMLLLLLEVPGALGVKPIDCWQKRYAGTPGDKCWSNIDERCHPDGAWVPHPDGSRCCRNGITVVGVGQALMRHCGLPPKEGTDEDIGEGTDEGIDEEEGTDEDDDDEEEEEPPKSNYIACKECKAQCYSNGCEE
jgi:hypothetical protein